MRTGLIVRERRHGAAVHEAGDAFLLRGAAGLRDGAADHERAQEGLDHEALAQALEDHGHVEAAAAEAAHGFGEQGAQRADLGQLVPVLVAAAGLAPGDVVALDEAVLLGQVAVQRVRQHAAVFGVCEVHGVAPLLTAQESSWR